MKNELTIEQSQHLIELGVDAKLASGYHVGRWEHYSTGSYPDPESVSPIFKLEDIISILPKEIDDSYLVICADNYEWKVFYSGVEIRMMDTYCSAPELIDSLYQLLCWHLTEYKKKRK